MPAPPLVEEEDGLRSCFYAEHPPLVLPSMSLEYAWWGGQHTSRRRDDDSVFLYTRRWALHHFSHRLVWRACKPRLCGCWTCRNDARL